MALIDCPECGANVSDSAPSCPKCGFPIATAGDRTTQATRTSAAAAPVSSGASTESPASTSQQAEPPPLPTERSAEPFRIAGRRVPIAALLFWGGMTVGVILKAFASEEAAATYRYVPFTMILLGVLWFSVTEFTMLIRHRKRR
ncbi:MAG: zinc ribbon domain-containing protein [Thiohalocapsa sp.]